MSIEKIQYRKSHCIISHMIPLTQHSHSDKTTEMGDKLMPGVKDGGE